MDAELKKTLKAVTLELRHLLEGRYDSDGKWEPGDLEQRLAAIGVRRDRTSVSVDELRHLAEEDRQARKVVDAYLKLREEAGVERSDAVAEFVRETAYTWANRLLALRCMEARELIDSVILQQETYGGRSLEHHRLAQRHPELCAGHDDGLFAVLDKVFREQAERLPMLFDPQAPGIALRPAPAALKDCFGLLSLSADTLSKYRIRPKEDPAADAGAEPPNPFTAPDALGWAYQYWNTEEKGRVFEKVRTVKGAKIAGADIVPATQLYTEDYMVKFLVQNSLGATWMGIHPESKLCEGWEHYVSDAERAPVGKKAIGKVTFLDPACGSGHFLLEAFDLFYAMYEEEGELTKPEEICTAILTQNLFGIDIDARSVQIAEAALWMKAAERAFDFDGAAINLVAATSSHLRGPVWEEFLASFQREPSVARVLRRFAQTMEHIHEIGSLARPAEDLSEIIKEEHFTWEKQVRELSEANYLFPEMREQALSGQLPFHQITDDDFGERLFYRAKAGIDAFTQRARETGEFDDQMLASETQSGYRLVDLLSRKYDVLAANPPYMGSANMGNSLHGFLDANFREGKFNLFAAFMLCAKGLLASDARLAMVCQRSWLTLGSFEPFRTSLGTWWCLETVADLGPGAFDAISGEVVSVALAIGKHCRSQREHGSCVFLDLRETESKSDNFCIHTCPNYRFRLADVNRLPGHRYMYRLTEPEIALFENWPPLRDSCFMTIGLITGANSRFTRMLHEVRPGERWQGYVKSQSSTRWAGIICEAVEWENSGARIRARYSDTGASGGKFNGEEFYGGPGLAATRVGGGALLARLFPAGLLFDSASSCGFAEKDYLLKLVCAYLNSSIAQRFAVELNGSFNYQAGDLNLLPLPLLSTDEYERLARLVDQAVELSDSLCASLSPIHLASSGMPAVRKSLAESHNQICIMCATIDTKLRACEQEIELAVVSFLRLTEIVNPKGRIGANETVPQISEGQFAEHYVGCSVLRILGYRWQGAKGVATDAFADSDSSGIVTLTSDSDDAELVSLLRAILVHDFGQSEMSSVERQFTTIVGMPLSTWLSRGFFPWHISYFKKRPIAWQLQSGKFAARTSPAFACLLYYHKLDADTLPKLRSQYVGPLRQRLETELRGILAVAAEARSDRQEERRAEIEDAVLELQRFDTILEAVVGSGFGPPSLVPKLRQYAVDDAMLALKARWLRQLTELIAKSPLPDWLATADRTELHPDLRSWIADAMAHLDYFCASVGPKPPDQSKLASDPTAADLARLIRPQADSMLKDALDLACEEWWKQFDEVVLAPDKDRIKGLKEEQRDCEEQLDADPGPSTSEIRQLKYRAKEIKEDVKILAAQIKRRTARADTVRTQIKSWQNKESSNWGDWLAGQPLFDRISSLDGRRATPTTIAEFIAQESLYAPDINDGVRVNIAPLQKAGLLADDVLASKDIDKAIADRVEWRADERRWVREGKLPQPGWWPENGDQS